MRPVTNCGGRNHFCELQKVSTKHTISPPHYPNKAASPSAQGLCSSMSSGALQPVRLGAQLPKYTPLPRPDGLSVGNLGAPLEAPVPMVNYKTRTGMDTWYHDREPNSQDCEYICQRDTDCMESSFDAVLATCALYGRVASKPSPHKAAPSAEPLISDTPSDSASASEGLLKRVVTLETQNPTKATNISKITTRLQSPVIAGAEAGADGGLWGVLTRAFDNLAGSEPTQPLADDDTSELPSLIVIGFQKAGTTYLRYLLSAHPELRTTCTRHQYQNEPSEVHYFDRLTQAEVLDHTRSKSGRVQLRQDYIAALRDKCGSNVLQKPITFDVTPGYSRLTVPAIKLVNMTLPPHTQFLALLRDPLELKKSRRVMHACIRGTPRNNCTLDEESPTDATWTDNYALHLERWKSVVGAHRMKTVLFDRLVDAPLDTLNYVLKMAGVAPMTELPDARKRPRQEEECQYEECGQLNDEIIAYYNQPSICNPLREQAREDLDELRSKMGVQTPHRWAKYCGGNHEGVTPYVGYNQRRRDLSTDDSLDGERARVRIS